MSKQEINIHICKYFMVIFFLWLIVFVFVFAFEEKISNLGK